MGTALCRRLEAAGHAVTGLNSKNCDLRGAGLDAFSGVKYDRVYHLAAWTQAGDFCLRHPGEQWIINQQINTNVLDWWRAAQPQAKLVCMGTSCSYSPGAALAEENYLEGAPIDSLFTYAMTKRMLYVGLLALHRQFGLNYLCLVPSTLYGPGYHTDGRQMHFIFDLIRKIARGKLYGDPVVLWGDGSQRRELVHVEDFTEIALRLDAAAENQLINIGSGEEFTIRHFAELICRKLDYDPALIRYDESRYVGARSKCLEITKLKKLLPGLSLTPLEAGLGSTVDWFLKEKDKLL
jgi:GDP-L-fucose synthase